MSRARVPVYNTPAKAVYIETDATQGATLGVDLYYNGKLLRADQVLNDFENGQKVASPATAPSTSPPVVAGQNKIQPRQNGALRGPAGSSNLNFVGAQVVNDGLTVNIVVNLTGTASGTNTYALTPSPALSGYFSGLACDVTFTNANTSAATLNISGLGAAAIQIAGAAMTGGEIVAGGTYRLVFNGTAFQLSRGATGPSGHGSTTTTAAPSASGGNWIFTLADTTAFSAVGLPIYCVDAATPSNWIRGHVISFSSTTLLVGPDATGGTISSITNGSTFTFSGVAGPTGPAGGGGGSGTIYFP